MSALIDATQGHYMGREDAWHKFGDVVGRFFTWEEALAAGKMGWKGVKKELISPFDGQPCGAFGIFRDDSHILLSTCGADYGLIDHHQGFDVMDALVHSIDGAHYSTLGFLGKGETVWGLVDLKLDIHVGDDITKNYLLMNAYYRPGNAHLYKGVNTRVVCNNTNQIALSEKSNACLRITHHKDAAKKLDKAQQALLSIKNDVVSLEERLNVLAGKKISKHNFMDMTAKLWPVENEAEQTDRAKQNRNEKLVTVLQRFEHNDGNVFKEQRGSAYNMLNAVTESIDHFFDQEKPERALKSACVGAGARVKEQAFEILLEMAPGMDAMPARAQVFVPAPVVASEPSYGSLDDILDQPIRQ